MSPRHPLVLIAAVARNGVIGSNGKMPWHLPGDLAHFRRATMGLLLLMGRRTFESIGRTLPGRDLVVVSADPGFNPGGVAVARSIDEGVAKAGRAADRVGAPCVMVAGGGTIYRALIASADALLLTAVEATPQGDTFFPPIDPKLWHVVDRHGPLRGPDDSDAYRIERWERRQPPSRVGNTR